MAKKKAKGKSAGKQKDQQAQAPSSAEVPAVNEEREGSEGERTPLAFSIKQSLTVLDAANGRVKVSYEPYQDETQMPIIMGLIDKDLSEPYSVFTYRYFIHNWPHLCLLVPSPECLIAGVKGSSCPDTRCSQAKVEGEFVGVIVCKADEHKKKLRGYVAMLAVDQKHRNLGIGELDPLLTMYLRSLDSS